MKKNRNSFFSETTNYAQMGNPQMMGVNQNMMYPANGMPNISAQSSFEAGPAMPNNMQMPMNNIPMNNMMSNQTEIEGRLAKIERQINRLEHRISKLEQNTTLSTNDYDSNINDMYMV